MNNVYKLHANLIKTGNHSNPVSLRSFVLQCARSPLPEAPRYAATLLLSQPTITVPGDPFLFNTLIKTTPSSLSISLFAFMHRTPHHPFDHFTFPLVLTALKSHLDPHHLHSLIIKLGFYSSLYVHNALIGAYGFRGSIQFAVKVFDEMPHRDLVSWSSLISCLARNGMPTEALGVFRQMQVQECGLKLDEVVMLSVVSAVSSLGALELGIWVHGFILRSGIDVGVLLGTALVDMYSRCGSIDRAVKVFDEMPHRNVVTWTTLISGFAVHGRSREALEAFHRMRESGLKPDRIAFSGALVACSHGGLVEEGWQVYESMRSEYQMEPMLEHYGCMVDLLGRAGLLDEAFKFVEEMPIQPNSVIWRTLLGACVNHNYLALAEKAKERITELEPHHDGDYVLLSNAYGGVGKWVEKAGLRNSMRENRIAKEPGCSWLHVDQTVHEFVSGDNSHPQWEEISKFLDSVIDTVKVGGYTQNTSNVLHDIQEEEKEHSLGYHSEKLAVAYLLLYHRDRRTIRVIKNLRICYDCHSFMKHVSVFKASKTKRAKQMVCSLMVWIAFWTLLLISVSVNNVSTATRSPMPPFSAMFVFGDSLVDNGNNNYLASFAKANYVPYGIDTSWGPTGRFSNGKMLVDLLGEFFGHPYLPSFAAAQIQGRNITWGVNYASAAAGILDETGRNLGARITFNQQVQNFQTTVTQLKTTMDDMNLSQYLAKSLAIVNHGSNDYINNYLLSGLYSSSFLYDPKTYADILIQQYKTQIQRLHDLGLRKFLLAGVGPLGCIPNQISKGLFPSGVCVDDVNAMVGIFNDRLRSLVDELNTQYSGSSIFVYGNTYAALTQIIQDPIAYGFVVTGRACCGVGSFQGRISCLPYSIPCRNRDQYVFWDVFHPSEAVNKILAQRAFNGSSSDCYPVNVSQMALLF
ncbi:hypothetical protein AHAS_Ahas18G0288100 [Arachis hypogaea]